MHYHMEHLVFGKHLDSSSTTESIGIQTEWKKWLSRCESLLVCRNADVLTSKALSGRSPPERLKRGDISAYFRGLWPWACGPAVFGGLHHQTTCCNDVGNLSARSIRSGHISFENSIHESYRVFRMPKHFASIVGKEAFEL